MSLRSPGPPRGILQNPTEEGRVEHRRDAPSPALEPFVAHFWTVRWDLRGNPSVLAETLPHPCVHITFERGRAEVGGVFTRRFSRRLRGMDRVFAIKFRPAAFQPFLRAPLSRITDRVVSLRSVFGPDADALTDAILRETAFERCIALAEAFLSSRLPALPPEIAQVRDVVEQLAADPGLTRVDQVAALMGVDLRTLQRRFRAAVGVSPKWVIRRYRLHEAAELLAKPDAPSMADLAQQLGYFDQAHFSRDFKTTVGKSPGEYVRAAASRSSARIPAEGTRRGPRHRSSRSPGSTSHPPMRTRERTPPRPKDRRPPTRPSAARPARFDQ